MNLIGKEEYIDYLRKLKFAYREKLNFKDDLTFGVEMEYCNAPNNKILRILNRLEENLDYVNYEKWHFHIDGNFSYSKKGVIYGGEVTTPVFTNTPNSYKEIKKVCNALRKYHATVDDRVGLHCHVSKDVFNNDYDVLVKFLKLYIVFEHVIYKFGYNGLREREALKTYAKDSRNILIDILKNDDSDEFYRLINGINNVIKAKERGINFQNIPHGIGSTNTIEFRMCNGTIDPIVVQNEINLFCSLLLSAKKDIDIEYLDYRIEDLKNKRTSLEMYRNINLDDAIIFSDIIFDDDLDKDYFMKQYIKE